MSTFIVAEAGSNHNRDINIAFKLIDSAVNARCNAVKFQTFEADSLYSKYVPDFGGYSNLIELLKSIELPREWQKELIQYCDERQIEFMSTPFDEKAIDQLYSLGIKRMKIAGFEAQDPRFIKEVAATKLPIIISLGIGIAGWSWTHKRDSINKILEWIYSVNPYADITMLHCNNAYPTPFEDINLKSMVEIKKILISLGYSRINVGLSDHTTGILIPPMAVALGAECIEKHITISRSMTGPDHHFAIEPQELWQMVKNIRIAENATGYKMESFTNSEKNFAVGTRVLVAKKKIYKDQLISKDNTTTKRGRLFDAVPAIEYENIIDKYIASNDLNEDEVLKWDMIQSKQTY